VDQVWTKRLSGVGSKPFRDDVRQIDECEVLLVKVSLGEDAREISLKGAMTFAD
jgi:hypothetical protein